MCICRPLASGVRVLPLRQWGGDQATESRKAGRRCEASAERTNHRDQAMAASDQAGGGVGRRAGGRSIQTCGAQQAGRSVPEHGPPHEVHACSELRLPTNESVSAIVGKISRVALWECLPIHGKGSPIQASGWVMNHPGKSASMPSPAGSGVTAIARRRPSISADFFLL